MADASGSWSISNLGKIHDQGALMRAPPDAQKRTPPGDTGDVAKTEEDEEHLYTPKQPTPQAFLIVHRTEPRPARAHVYIYSMEFEGEIVVERSVDAACDLARALLARGLTGHVKVIHKETGQHRYTVNIEKAAKVTVREDARVGPRFVKWRPNGFLSDVVSHRSGEATLEGTQAPKLQIALHAKIGEVRNDARHSKRDRNAVAH
jgi:hypothetical protein